MKKIFQLFILLLALISASCTEELLHSLEAQAEQVTVRFLVNIPAYQTEHTRSSNIDENGINSLSLLVFNEDGIFIYMVEADISTSGSFTASLLQSSECRIVHFVANQSWPPLFEVKARGRSEGELIPTLTVSSELGMWTRVELPEGISANAFGTEPVSLVRNMAKISVDNQATVDFTLNGFSIYRAPTHGTVAPFDAAASLFTEDILTEPAGISYSVESGSLSPSDNWYLYERQNGQESNNDYIFAILEGTYNGATHYYKIDLLDGNKKRCDILRNHHYKINVKKVMKPGYASLNEAKAGTPSNGSMDVSVSQSPIISDGESKLQVDQTLFLFTRNGSNLDVGFRYYPNIDINTFNNSGVTVELIEDDPLKPVVEGTLNVLIPSADNEEGRITAAIHDVPADNETRTARIIVRKNDLLRTIRLVLHQAYSFEPVTINGQNMAPLTNQGTDAELEFNIPSDYPSEMFPLEVRIQTNGLVPTQGGMRLEVVNGDVSYLYSVATPGTKTVSFKTAYPNYYEVVKLDAMGFVSGTTGYNVKETTGDINYKDDMDGNTSKPVPHAGSADLAATVGYISVPVEDGKYVWTSSTGTSGTTPVEVSFRKRITPTLTKRYTKQVTANNLSDNSTITLELTDNIAKGSLTYGTTNNPVPAGATLTFIPDNLPLVVTADGSYEYTYLPGSDNTNSVDISYTMSNSNRRSDIYTETVSYSDLRAGNPINLEQSSSKVMGTITYGSSYSSVPEGSTITVTDENGNVAVFPSGFSFTVLPYSEYKLDFPAGTTTFGNNLYTFTYVNGSLTYRVVVTLDYLKDGNRIHLNNYTVGNNNDQNIFMFSTIHYRNNGVDYPVLKDQGTFTVSTNPQSDIKSYTIVADGVYKLEFNTVQNPKKKITFTYTIDGVTYSLEDYLYGTLVDNPNIVLPRRNW